jgi:hypothetical protein
MLGIKIDEERNYKLGYQNIARADRWQWLVETPGDKAAAEKLAVIPDGVHLPPRPDKARFLSDLRVAF